MEWCFRYRKLKLLNILRLKVWFTWFSFWSLYRWHAAFTLFFNLADIVPFRLWEILNILQSLGGKHLRIIWLLFLKHIWKLLVISSWQVLRGRRLLWDYKSMIAKLIVYARFYEQVFSLHWPYSSYIEVCHP